MAMHYLRSSSMIHLLSISEKKYFDEFIEQAKVAHPDKVDDINSNLQTLRTNWQRSIVFKELPELLDSLSSKIDKFIEKFDLEIGTVPSNKLFFLGDVPIWNGIKNGPAGIINGVPIDKSDGVILPLGPFHIVALITKNESTDYKVLPEEHVDIINRKLIEQSLLEYNTFPQ